MNHLILHNNELLSKALLTKNFVEKKREQRGFVSAKQYTLSRIASILSELLRSSELLRDFTKNESDIDLQIIERKKFGDDLCLKLPRLLKEQGNVTYMQVTIPTVLNLISSDPKTKELFSSVTVKGIYINIRLADGQFVQMISDVITLGERYGESDRWKRLPIVVDYSSPNIAKTLHAGHIRSTIIGHILSNLYETIGGYVYRTNHLNDLGGVGYIVVGYKRWKDLLSTEATEGTRISELYSIFRSLQKIYDSGATEDQFNDNRDKILRYFPTANSRDRYVESFSEFKREATAFQESLERGDEEAVEEWRPFVTWSLEEFERFYRLLGVEIDIVLGESFYLPDALNLINESVKAQTAVVWDRSLLDKLIAELEGLLAEDRISKPVFDTLVKDAEQDLGATVVPLSNFNRAVILRADGISIYTSRDLQAIKFRVQIFGAKRIVYEVGVEQKDHFAKLFEAARILNLCDESTELVHVSHESYVDSITKKKLSSRDGSSGVEELLSSTIKYFKNKYGKEEGFSSEETDRISKQLGVGSVIFNDIKKDKKYPVEIQAELSKMHEEFERSGGAYVVYTACRARSIIRKWGKELPNLQTQSKDYKLDAVEIELLKELAIYPDKIFESAKLDSPAILTQYLLELARRYSSYYSSFPVLKGDEVHEHRLLITKAVQTVLENGLRICLIECPERI